MDNFTCSLLLTLVHTNTPWTHTQSLYLYYVYVFVSLVIMCLHVCFTMFVSHFVCAVLSCPVVLACQPITDMIEWAGSGCIQGWLIWGWWPTWSHCITPFELLFSVWQLIQNTQLWLVESLWGFRLHTFHSVWSFEHVASWEQDLAVMNLNGIWFDLEMTMKWKCYDTVNCYWSHTNVRSSTR